MRNLSVTFSTEGNETAEPALPVNTGPPGSYQDLGPDGLPKLWRVEGGEAGEWEVVDGAKNCSHHGVPTTCNTFWCHNATDTSCGRFMRANVTTWPCTSASGSDGKVCENRSAILTTDPFVVESPTALRLVFWSRVDHLGPNCTGAGPTVTAVLTGVTDGNNYSLGEMAISPFERILRAHENAIGDRKVPLHTWQENSVTFVTNHYIKPPPACTPIPPDGRCAPTQPDKAIVEISSSVGGTCSASWSLSPMKLERLDSALKNILRTSATDFELRLQSDDGQPGELLTLGRDYTVVNGSRSDAEVNDFDRVESKPYQVRRVDGGRIPRGAKAFLSFDFLPGVTATGEKPDVATSLAEPLWFSVAQEAIANVTRIFGHLDYIALGFDEVRGAFRDSRTARSGKTNAELMAHAINELSRMVHEASPNTTAVFWADMINPYHNGQNGLLGNGYNLACAYQVRWGGRPGCTGLVLSESMLDPTHPKLLLPWAYGYDKGCADPETNWKCINHQVIEHSAALFRNATQKWAAVPWANRVNFELWAAAVRDGGDFSQGYVDSDWNYHETPTQWGDVPDTSSCAWNLGSCLAAGAR